MRDRAEFAASLRKLADWYEEHPTIPLPDEEISVTADLDSKEAAAEILRACLPCKKEYTGGLFVVKKPIGSLTLKFIFWRDAVCERVVVGTKEVPEKVIPATEERIEPAHIEEIVEWRCEPVMQEREAA